MLVVMSKGRNELKRHADKEEAMAEAKRLCLKEGAPMEVYELIGHMQPKERPVEFIDIGTRDSDDNA